MDEDNANNTKPPVRRMVAISLLMLGLLFVFCVLIQPWLRHRYLKDACEKADRVVVDLNLFSMSSADEDGPVFPVFEVKGEERAHALLNAIVLRRNWLPVRCRSLPNMVFRFYQGADYLASVEFCEGEFLRWPDLQWGEAWLTEESQTQLLAWLRKNGCPSSEEARQQQTAIVLAWHAETQPEGSTRFAASSPDDVTKTNYKPQAPTRIGVPGEEMHQRSE